MADHMMNAEYIVLTLKPADDRMVIYHLAMTAGDAARVASEAIAGGLWASIWHRVPIKITVEE